MAKPTKWNDILDMCLNRIAGGERVEDCLHDFPNHADKLKPLLETAVSVHQPQRRPAASSDARIKAAMLQVHREKAKSNASQNSPVSSSWFSRLIRRNQTKRRVNEMKQPIFVRYAGAIAIIAMLAVASAYIVGLTGNSEPEANVPATTAVESIIPTPQVTEPVPTTAPTNELLESPLAWELFTEELTSPDGTLRAVGQTYYVKGEDDIWLNIDVRNAGNGGYSESVRFPKEDIYEVRPIIIGWSANSDRIYFTSEVVLDETCNVGEGYLGLYVLSLEDDLLTFTLTTLREPYQDNSFFADFELSPDRSKLAVMSANEEEEVPNIEVFDVDSTDVVSQNSMAEASWAEGMSFKLSWLEDSSEVAIDTEPTDQDCTNSVTNSNDDIVYDESTQTPDEAEGTENSIVPINKDENVIVTQTIDPTTSPDGAWAVTVEATENGADLLDILMTVVSGASGVNHIPIQETREVGFGGTSLPHPLGWSQDSRYFFFADRGFPDGCDADLSIYTNLRRLDVTTGSIEAIYNAEMASVAISFDGENLVYMPRPYPNNQFVSMTVIDTTSLGQVSSHLLNSRYVEGATTNKLHWSADSKNIIAELHTIWCPILDGKIDFWQIEIGADSDLTGDNVGPIFSSAQIDKEDARSIILGFDQFVDDVLQVSEAETMCVFETSATTLIPTSSNCANRLP